MGIKIDKVDDGLPISVVVPLSKNRKDFFENMVLPILEANNPNEIIIVDDDGLAPKKRNKGFKKSTQPFLFFMDDDIVLPKNHLENLYNELIKQHKSSSIGFTYSGYKGIVLNPETHPMKGNFSIQTIEYNINRLKQANFISTMALVRRDVFPGFDENLKRFQDYDIWLTLLNKGIHGKAVFNNEFYAYYLDEGITSQNNNINEAMNIIRTKHKLY
jgi:glycosyltransferase involved in cell wall biosynthesis